MEEDDQEGTKEEEILFATHCQSLCEKFWKVSGPVSLLYKINVELTFENFYLTHSRQDAQHAHIYTATIFTTLLLLYTTLLPQICT